MPKSPITKVGITDGEHLAENGRKVAFEKKMGIRK